MSAALWLTRRELAVRWPRVVLAALVVAALAATSTSLELLGRAREEAVAAQIDAMGPALTIVPPGTTASDVARRELGDQLLLPSVAADVEAAIGGDLRALEQRLVLTRTVADARIPVIGVEEPTAEVAAGSELARRLGDVRRVAVDGQEVAIRAVRPSTGSAEDVALVLPLARAQALAGADAVNELRVYLRAGVSAVDVERRLTVAGLPAAVVRHDRGAVAEVETQAALVRHRALAHAVFAIMAALCLLIAAHLDASERRNEIATLVAIGAGRGSVVAAIVSRSALVAAVGAVLGAAAGAAIAAGQEPFVTAILPRAWAVPAAALVLAVLVGALAAAPSALASALRDPVPELQET